jgi:acetyl-CoA synthetase
MGTAEVESALVANTKVAEAAVVGYPHDIKGQGIYAYVTLKTGVHASEELRKELGVWVRKEIGPIAQPDLIQWAPGLPKTRSGKIMRRILRKIAEDDLGNLGDTSTLADPAVVDDLVKNRAGQRGEEHLSVGGQTLNAVDLEAALRAHAAIAEAAVVGVPKSGGEEAIHAFVCLEPGLLASDVMRADIRGWMRREVGPFAAPEVIQFAAGLPKSRSGEVVRPLLRKIAAGEVKDLGDTSALADPSVVGELIRNRTPAEA